jgi:hypothetical protein
MTTESYKTWWELGNEQLDKISSNQNHPLRMIHERLFSDIHTMGSSPPDVDVSDHEVLYTWKTKEFCFVVTTDENLSRTLSIPSKSFECQLPLKEGDLAFIRPMFVNKPEDTVREEDEFSTVPVNPPVKKNDKDIDINHMLSSMFSKFDQLVDNMADLQKDDNENPKPMVENLDSVGLCIKTMVLGFISLLAWIISRVGTRFPGRAVFKTMILETLEDVRGGFWDDIFESPGIWLQERSERIYKIIDSIFLGINWMIRYNRVSLTLLAFTVGYML